MVFNKVEIMLKDGRSALLRSPCEDDAEEMFKIAGESEERTYDYTRIFGTRFNGDYQNLE